MGRKEPGPYNLSTLKQHWFFSSMGSGLRGWGAEIHTGAMRGRPLLCAVMAMAALPPASFDCSSPDSVVEAAPPRSLQSSSCASEFPDAHAKVAWAANKRFEISKFKFNFPRARTFELFRARSLLYRSQILPVNTRWKALAEIYTMHSFARFLESVL